MRGLILYDFIFVVLYVCSRFFYVHKQFTFAPAQTMKYKFWFLVKFSSCCKHFENDRATQRVKFSN